jgi:hypothetical protein
LYYEKTYWRPEEESFVKLPLPNHFLSLPIAAAWFMISELRNVIVARVFLI